MPETQPIHAYEELLAAGQKWRVLRSEVAMMEDSQSDEMGFSDAEIEPFRRAYEEAEANLQMVIDGFGLLSPDEERAILFPALNEV